MVHHRPVQHHLLQQLAEVRHRCIRHREHAQPAKPKPRQAARIRIWFRHLRPVLSNRQNIRRKLLGIAMELQPEPVSQQLLHHRLQLMVVRRARNIRLSRKVELVRLQPRRPIQDLLILHAIGELDQARQRCIDGVKPVAVPLKSLAPLIRSARLHRRYLKTWISARWHGRQLLLRLRNRPLRLRSRTLKHQRQRSPLLPLPSDRLPIWRHLPLIRPIESPHPKLQLPILKRTRRNRDRRSTLVDTVIQSRQHTLIRLRNLQHNPHVFRLRRRSMQRTLPRPLNRHLLVRSLRPRRSSLHQTHASHQHRAKRNPQQSPRPIAPTKPSKTRHRQACWNHYSAPYSNSQRISPWKTFGTNRCTLLLKSCCRWTERTSKRYRRFLTFYYTSHSHKHRCATKPQSILRNSPQPFGCNPLTVANKSSPTVRVFAIASSIEISVISVPRKTTSRPNLPACTRSIAASPYRVASMRSYAVGVPPRCV